MNSRSTENAFIRIEQLRDKLSILKAYDESLLAKYEWVNTIYSLLESKRNAKLVCPYEWKLVKDDAIGTWNIQYMIEPGKENENVIDSEFRMFKALIYLTIKLQNEPDKTNLINNQEHFAQLANKNGRFFSDEAHFDNIGLGITRQLKFAEAELTSEINQLKKRKRTEALNPPAKRHKLGDALSKQTSEHVLQVPFSTWVIPHSAYTMTNYPTIYPANTVPQTYQAPTLPQQTYGAINAPQQIYPVPANLVNHASHAYQAPTLPEQTYEVTNASQQIYPVPANLVNHASHAYQAPTLPEQTYGVTNASQQIYSAPINQVNVLQQIYTMPNNNPIQQIFQFVDNQTQPSVYSPIQVNYLHPPLPTTTQIQRSNLFYYPKNDLLHSSQNNTDQQNFYNPGI